MLAPWRTAQEPAPSEEAREAHHLQAGLQHSGAIARECVVLVPGIRVCCGRPVAIGLPGSVLHPPAPALGPDHHEQDTPDAHPTRSIAPR
jgi:hypothetical protein